MYFEKGLQIFIVVGKEAYKDIMAGGYYPNCNSTNDMIATIGTIINNYDGIKEDIKKRRRKISNKLLAIHMLESAGDSLDDKARRKALRLFNNENFSLNGNGTINFELNQFYSHSERNVIIDIVNEFVDFHDVEKIGYEFLLKPNRDMVEKIDIDNLEGEEKRILEVFRDRIENGEEFDLSKYPKRGGVLDAQARWLHKVSDYLSEEEVEYGWKIVMEKWIESLKKIKSNGLYSMDNVPFKNWSLFTDDMSKLDDYPFFCFDEHIVFDCFRDDEQEKKSYYSQINKYRNKHR